MSWLLAAVIAVAGSLAAAADSAADPTPTSGPTAGGTTVADQVSGVVFDEVLAGGQSGYAVSEDGTLYAWGANVDGQLGDGTTTARSYPAPTSLATLPAGALPFTQVVASHDGAHVLGLGSDGVLYAWGSNLIGQLGVLGGNRPSPVPVNVSDVDAAALPFAQIFAGGNSSYALGSDGTLYAWGSNTWGQLGIANNAVSAVEPVPVSVSGLPPAALPFTQVVAGGQSAMALGSNGLLYSWGYNSSGQLGDGTSVPRYAPVPVNVSGLPPAAQPFTQIAAGTATMYALGADGVLYAWGSNSGGQIGDGTTINRNLPVAVDVSGLPAGATPFTQVVAGAASAYALGANGVLYAWGSNANGELGDGTTAAQRLTPIAVVVVLAPSAALPFSQIAAGQSTGYALGRDGFLYAWGYNASGQVGDGTANTRRSVTPISAVSVTRVSFGGVAGTSLSYQYDGPWTVRTPAGCGPVDVTVEWRQFGVAHTDTYPNGFAFGSAPTITTQPSSATFIAGETFTTTAAASGDDAPVISWQQQDPATGAWLDIPGATGETLSVSGLTAATNFRAIATNCWGAQFAAASTVATASPEPCTPQPPSPTPPGPTPTPPISQPPSPTPPPTAPGDCRDDGLLAVTGTPHLGSWAAAGFIVLIAGTALSLVGTRIRRRS